MVFLIVVSKYQQQIYMVCKEKNLFQEVEVSFKFSSDDNLSMEKLFKSRFCWQSLEKVYDLCLRYALQFFTNSAWIYIEFTRDRNKTTSTLF